MEYLKQRKNFIWSLGILVVLYAVLSFFFDFYYDLNDDVMIKDMLEGCFSGEPSGYNNQMLYPLSLLISLPYHLTASVPWFAFFLAGCQFLSFVLILARIKTLLELNAESKRENSLEKTSSRRIGSLVGWLVSAIYIIFILIFLVWEVVYHQYTISCGILVATACFLTYSNEAVGKNRWKDDILSLILLLLAMNIRSEMFLLCSPFIAFTGIVMWIDSIQRAKKENLSYKKIHFRYLVLAGEIVLLFVISLVLDGFAYSGTEWKEYRNFFDARTKVYDYTWYPEYEDAKEFYQEIGLSESQISLIDHYNFGLDEEINGNTLWKIAEYSEQNNKKEAMIQRLKPAMTDYLWRSTHSQDAPFNYIVITAYLLVAVLAVIKKEYWNFGKLFLLEVFRTIPWMYVILSRRVPNRISHPLYFIELIILLALILNLIKDDLSDNSRKNVLKILVAIMTVIVLMGLFMLPPAFQKVAMEQQRRAEVNRQMEMFDAFAKNHSENYYYLDVYSTVDFSEKMFADRRTGFKNYNIIGGWGFGSPLLKDAVDEYLPFEQQGKAFDESDTAEVEPGELSLESELNPAEQLLTECFYFVAEKEAELSYITDFYQEKNQDISMKVVAEVGDFNVYHFEKE